MLKTLTGLLCLFAAQCVTAEWIYPHAPETVIQHTEMAHDFVFGQMVKPENTTEKDNKIDSNTSKGKSSNPRVSIIIDDLGYSLEHGQKAIDLKHPITLAIIPFTPHAQNLALSAAHANKEMMLHVPMEANNYHNMEPGLSVVMTRVEMDYQLMRMIESIPGIRGVNNHGGSRFSEDPIRTHWLLEEVKNRDLFFIDSRTTAKTAFGDMAKTLDVRFGKRDIFLDNIRKPEAIIGQLEQLKQRARLQGTAIAIGHPYPETLAVLAKKLPEFAAQGIDIVYASHLTQLPKGSNKPKEPVKPVTPALWSSANSGEKAPNPVPERIFSENL